MKQNGRVNIRLKKELFNKYFQYCKLNNISMSKDIREFIKKKIKNYEKKNN